jgi:hypothetical protein
MSVRLAVWCPCAVFFTSGRAGAGLLALTMQLSLLLWPVASRWARGSHEQRNIERMLVQLTQPYRPVVIPDDKPVKRFRQVA